MELPGTRKPTMVAKDHVQRCHDCNAEMKWSLSKINCGLCGQVFCKQCCQKKIPLSYKKLDSGKVCNKCLNEEVSYVHVLMIWLQLISKMAVKCFECKQSFTLTDTKYGCLACQQIICSRCIPLEVNNQGDVVSKCRKCIYQRVSGESLTIFEMEVEMRKIQIELINLIADSIDVHDKRINTTETALSSVGVVGGILAITGFGLSFVTFGASLGLFVAAGVIGGTAGAANFSAQVARYIIKKKSWNILETICHQIEEVKDKRWKLHIVGTILTGGGTAGSVYSATNAGVNLAKIRNDKMPVGQTAATVGTTASKTLFSASDIAGKVFLVGGAVFSVVGMAFDIYTIIDRAQKLHKKKPAEAAENMRKLAEELEKQLADLTQSPDV